MIIQVIFLPEKLNEINIEKSKFIQKYKNIKEFKDLNCLLEINKTLIVEGCKLNINMLDPKGNRMDGWNQIEFNAGFPYYPPIGWRGFG